MGYEIVYASMTDFLEGKVSEDWRPSLDLSSMLLPRPLRPFAPGQAPPEGFDALVVTLPSLFESDGATVDAVLKAAAPLMAKDASLFATATVQMNEIAYEGGFSYAEWKALYSPEGPMGMRGFRPLGGFDDRIPMDTVVRFAFEDDPQDSIPGLSYGFLKGFNSSALLCARWPHKLADGPTARIEYGQTHRPDPANVRLPYSGGQVSHAADLAAAPQAAQAAAFLAVKTLEGMGSQALLTAPLLALGPASSNALPFIVPFGEIERSVMNVVLAAPGGAGLILPVNPNGAGSLAVSLNLSEGVRIVEAVAIDERGASIPVIIESNRVAVSGSGPLPKLAIAIRLSEVRTSVQGLTLSPA
jgi:hypothetical protein